MASSFTIRLLLLASSFFYGAWAQCTEEESCVQFPVVHSTNTNIFSKRAVEVQLSNRSDVAYYAQLNIGSPAQPVYVQLDTGSFELWVNPTCSALDASDQEFCNAVGFYDATKSSTAVNLQTTKTLNYGIGSANITYFKDSIALPGASSAMSGVQFGVATSSRSQFSGILGIGYGLGLTTRYPNFVDNLATQNQTKVKAYSVALGSKDEGEGVIVFGGVDTSKFAGRLATLPIVPAADSPDGVPRYWITMNNMSITPPSGNRKMYPNSSMDVFLDTGSTLTLLPQAICDQLGADFGSSGLDESGFYPVDCNLADLPGTIDFDFNGVEIKVPYNEFIRTSTGSFGQDSCVLGITPSESFTLLGDTFMRSAYGMSTCLPSRGSSREPSLTFTSQPSSTSRPTPSTCSSTQTAALRPPPSPARQTSPPSRANAPPRVPWSRAPAQRQSPLRRSPAAPPRARAHHPPRAPSRRRQSRPPREGTPARPRRRRI